MFYRILPPLYRTLEKLSLDQPRVFFLQASNYTKVPRNLDDHEHPIPTIQRIPSMLHRFARPGRSRSVSVGPQSVGDVYEMIDYQHELRKRRQSSRSRSRSVSNASNTMDKKQPDVDDADDDAVQQATHQAEMFKQIPQGRIRYDVEVVTRLICYCGIGWISVDFVHLIFYMTRLS